MNRPSEIPSESPQKSETVRRAQSFLRGDPGTLSELIALAEQLKREREFGLARRIFSRARRDPELRINRSLTRTLAQQHALCMSRDPDLPASQRFDRALEILDEEDPLDATLDQETLGIAGGICKRKWEFDGQKSHLDRALVYYLRGYNVGVVSDNGYTGINAAYILDLLAAQEPRELQAISQGNDAITTRREQARRIRDDVCNTLLEVISNPEKKSWENEWWFVVTIAEAYFGQQKYLKAANWLEKARSIRGVSEWEYESTARQLASIARLQAESGDSGSLDQLAGSHAWEVLSFFLQDNLAGVRTAFVGKVGLALSGGGFRASLFHIGVLAKLAELDLLRHVEVLSCVSGGSIIGAHYYLEARRLLQEKPDKEITREDYIDIVRRIEKDFLEGVETNIRTRVLAEFWTNLKLILLPNYSRTLRVGELLEENIFSRVKDREGSEPRRLRDLRIQPPGEVTNFAPKFQNWRRRAKVPILVINATTLNTGHNWQFTSSWMGEPPSSIETEIDGNYRFRRMYYDEAPAWHRDIRLGHAVAASACVPGLFEPLALTNLYPEKTVRLVDGGVHDNQGTATLIEQECAVMIVSDASGQMRTQDDANNSFWSVPLRSNSILQARVRVAQFHELDARRRSALLRGLVFVHLKKDLDEDPINWIDCADPVESSDEAQPLELRGPATRYRILKRVQTLLAGIRTDLDSFAEGEAYALMTSGYRMIEAEFARLSEQTLTADSATGWRFLGIEGPMQRDEGADPHYKLWRLLETARHRGFKIWRLSPLEPALMLMAIIGFVVLAAFAIYRQLSEVAPLYSIALTVLGIFLIGVFLVLLIVRAISYRKTVGQLFPNFVLGTVGWPIARLHLHLFDKFYLRWGRLTNFQTTNLEQPSSSEAAAEAIST